MPGEIVTHANVSPISNEISSPTILVGIDDVHAIYDKSFSSFYGYAYSLTFSKDLAYELVQNVFARIVARVQKNSLSNIDSLEAYVIRSIRNAVFNNNKKNDSDKVHLSVVGRDAPSSESEYMTLLTGQALEEAIAGLSSTQKLCIVMHYYDDMSVDEISRELGVSSSTIKTHLQRARKNLSQNIKMNEDAKDEK